MLASARRSMTSTICPACGKEAPIVYRGVVPFCAACGAMRAPLSSASVNLAGKPSRVGSTLATVLGWLVLVVGGSAALGVIGVALLLGWTTVAAVLGGPIALFALVGGLLLLRAGRSLAASATAREQSMLDQGLMALAGHRGSVTARDAAQALQVSIADADAALTSLAKREPERLGVDVDEQGTVWYRAVQIGAPRVRVTDGLRVSADAAPSAAAADPLAGADADALAGADADSAADSAADAVPGANASSSPRARRAGRAGG